MVRAVMNDLLAAGETNVVICRDDRLPALHDELSHFFLDEYDQQRIIDLLETDDLIWLIAPETGAVLAELVSVFCKQDCRLISSSYDAIVNTSSKYNCFQVLTRHDIPTIETVRSGDAIPQSNQGWVVKPDDGAGAEECHLFRDKNALLHFIQRSQADLIIQPYIEGDYLSLSMLCHQGKAVMLACNQQNISIGSGGKIRLESIVVNGALPYLTPLSSIASHIAQAFPGLYAYVGVDVINDGEQFFVVDINPRFTTSYVGLSESLGCNVASKIMQLLVDNKLPEIDITAAIPVKIDL